MGQHPLQRLVREKLLRRSISSGGIADHPGGEFRTDATAWGILALDSAGEPRTELESHCARLVGEQGQDGRVSIHRRHSDSAWPTALAVLAWQGSPASQVAQGRAVQFLLRTTGLHAAREAGDPAAHDTLLKGWPWNDGTASWIEPTALAVLALQVAGHGAHDRVQEAFRMLLDRQLPHGGWNYGNTLVFGKELHPAPESTGAALAGLAGSVERSQVSRSLNYLQGEIDRLRTPISLGWSLFGLAAWGVRPPNALALAERCLRDEARYGSYETSALSLLFLGARATWLEPMRHSQYDPSRGSMRLL